MSAVNLKTMLTAAALASGLFLSGIVAAPPAAHAQEADEPTAQRSALATAWRRMQAGEYAVARGLLEPLVAAGRADAQHMLGYMEERGLGGDVDLKRALDLYFTAASKGSVDAQFSLGEMAFLGDGVKRDYKRARGWYELASEKNHGPAKVRLGAIYAAGLGLENPDHIKALDYFKQAADLGEVEAQYNVGVAYLIGRGVEKDYKTAEGWLRLAAEKGNPDAQYNLALLHDTDFLGARDPEKTLQWMQAAADKGLPPALNALGQMHMEGRAGVSDEKRRHKIAADIFEKSAKAGDAKGQFLYALSLANGQGRLRNLDEAVVWLDRARAQARSLDPNTTAAIEKLRTDVVAVINGPALLRE
ncbi:MAG: tetratricopeptide repeat protein [Pseudomonadota bacterium]